MSNYAGFTSIQVKAPSKSRFDLSHQKRLSTRMGLLVPTMVIETLPGDSFTGSCQVLTRVAPLLSPVYETLTVYFHTFYQAYRNVWEDWEEFIWGGRLGVGIDPVIAPVPPYFDLGTWLAAEPASFTKSSLSDYLGVPVLPIFPDDASDYANVEMQLIPYAVYQSIWYEYYRDRNYVADSVFDFPLPSGIMASGVGDFQGFVRVTTSRIILPLHFLSLSVGRKYLFRLNQWWTRLFRILRVFLL